MIKPRMYPAAFYAALFPLWLADVLRSPGMSADVATVFVGQPTQTRASACQEGRRPPSVNERVLEARIPQCKLPRPFHAISPY